MRKRLPLNADIITATYADNFGSIIALAHTDQRGIPHLAVATIKHGKLLQNTRPLWFCNTRFNADLIIGFEDDAPRYVNVRIKISGHGLQLVVRPSVIHPPKDGLNFTSEKLIKWDDALTRARPKQIHAFENTAAGGTSSHNHGRDSVRPFAAPLAENAL